MLFPEEQGSNVVTMRLNSVCYVQELIATSPNGRHIYGQWDKQSCHMYTVCGRPFHYTPLTSCAYISVSTHTACLSVEMEGI